MTRSRARIALVVALAIVGCAARTLDTIDSQLRNLHAECGAAAPTSSCQQRYATLATQALADARGASADPPMRVAFYRAAAVASFEAGPLGSQTVIESTDEGTQACQGLPQQDASAPRDCAVLRLMLPLAVADDLSRKVTALVSKRDALRQGNPAARLPASDLPTVLNLYDGLETQLDKVSAVSATLTDPPVPAQLRTYADDQRRAVYCWAMKAYSVAFDVQGVTPASMAETTARKTAMRTEIERSLGVIDCRSTPPLTVPQA